MPKHNVKKKSSFSLISTHIKELRGALNLSQRVFAENLGAVQGFISDIENGRRELLRSLIVSLVDIYSVNANWLLTGEGSMFRSEGELPAPAPDEFRRTVPDVYALYEENKRLKVNQPPCCPACPVVNRLDGESQAKVVGYAEGLLAEQKKEYPPASPFLYKEGRKDTSEDTHEPEPDYGQVPDEPVPMPLIGRIAAGKPLDMQAWPNEWQRIRLKPGEGVTLKRLKRDKERRIMLAWQDGSERVRELTSETLIQGVFVRAMEVGK